jgi:hypothetical protein
MSNSTTTALETFLGSALEALGVSSAMLPIVAAESNLTALQAIGSVGTLNGITTPVMQIAYTEALDLGAAFYDGVVVNHVRTGGTGHRQAFTGQITSSGANAGEFLVGSAGFGFLAAGSGNVFGMNAYAQAMATVTATAQVAGMEINTDVRTPVAVKTGLQIVDVATSTSDATTRSAGLYIARQPGGIGWQAAIQFGDASAAATMAPTDGDLILLAGTAGSVPLQRGIDFRAGKFSLPAIDLPPGSAIAWGGGTSGLAGVGGSIISLAGAAGPLLELGEGAFAILDNASTTQAFTVITTLGSQSVGVYIPGVGLRTITAGAANSAGPGNRLLLCAN